MLLRLALEAADRVVNALPSGLAYRLADLGGDAWRRLAPGRRRLVAANLARVCAATGRPTRGPSFRRLVRDAFRHHARYYLEILRAPHIPLDRIDESVSVPGWPEFEPLLRGGPAMLVSWHLGNPEPFATFLAARGMRPLAPIEVIEPPALFAFLVARRGAGHPELVALDRSARPMNRRLREGGLVALVADRDISGDGMEVTVFGHATTMPTGPAWLATAHRVALLAGRCLRTGPDRFHADGELLVIPDSGDRRTDIAELTERLARRLERDVADAPEQWWGAFQPFWPDLAAGEERG
jgi:KDO2-lipid IV(A) lauroyltransferase